MAAVVDNVRGQNAGGPQNVVYVGGEPQYAVDISVG